MPAARLFRAISLICAVLFVAAVSVSVQLARHSSPPRPAPTAKTDPANRPDAELRDSRPRQAYNKLPLSFTSGREGADGLAQFVARGAGYQVSLLKARATLRLGDSALTLALTGANPRPRGAGRNELPGKINDLRGSDSSRWRTNLSTFAKIAYDDVYPGVDLVFYGNQQQLEYDFIVAPQRDASRIRLRFAGANAMRLNGQGDLILRLDDGELRQHKPIVYQETNGQRRYIAGNYKLHNQEVGFEIGDYDHARPLVIDPVLSYAGYLGGSGDDQATGLAVDASGNVIVTGSTASADFATASARQSALAGATDIFVTKMRLDADGTATLLFSTYIGGHDEDRGNGVAVDAVGNVYVAGVTTSTDFPTASGAQVSFGSSAVFKSTNGAGNWTPRGSGLSAGTVNALVIDPSAADILYAATAGGGVLKTVNGGGLWQPANGDAKAVTPKLLGSNDVRALAIAAGKLYVGTSRGVYSTADGGVTWNAPQLQLATDATAQAINRARENVRALAIDPTNAAIVYVGAVGGVFKSTDGGASSTLSNTGLPNLDATTGLSTTTVQTLAAANATTLYAGTTDGVFKTTNAGANWTAKNTGLTAPNIRVLVIDPANTSVLYAGTPSGVFKSTNGGDTWAASNTGLALLQVRALAIDGTAVYAATAGGVFKSTDAASNWAASNTGQTNTDPRALAVKGATVYLGAVGSGDAVLFKLSSNGANLLYSTYLGGGATDVANGLAVDASGNAVVTGVTASPNLPTQSALTASLGGSSDAFVAKLNTTLTGNSSLVYATYLGGGGADQGNGIALDTAGNAYVTGATASPNFPITDKAIQKKYGNNAAFKSANGGASWSAVGTGIAGDITNAIAVNGTAIIAANINGVFKSTDGGATWAAKNNGLSNVDVRALLVDGTTIYAGTAGGVFKSVDGGDAWSAASSGLTQASVRTLAADRSTTPTTLYAGTSGGGVFKSVNGGTNWAPRNGPTGGQANTSCANCLPATNAVTGESSATITAIVAASSSSLFAAVSGNGVFKSTDGGANWSANNSGLPQPLPSIQTLAADANAVYAGTNAGVFKSTDGSATWAASNGGLANLDVRALTIAASAIYAGTSGGVFKSVNGGASWTAVNTGLTSAAISSIAVDAAGELYAGSNAVPGDAFLAQLSAAGDQLLFATFWGGGDSDTGNGIVLGAGGAIYLTGTTQSNNFAVTANAFGKNYGGRGDAFVTVINLAAGGDASLSYSTFLGGENSDQGNGIAVTAGGLALVTGSTASANFPVADAISPFLNGAADAFIASVDVSTGSLTYSTFLGGSGSDAGMGIAVDAGGAAHVAGVTASTNFPVTAGALDKACCGTVNGVRDNGDGFIAKINSTAPPADLSITKEATGNFRVGDQATYTMTVRNAGPGVALPPLRVVDPLPAELSFDSFIGTDWNCTAQGQLVTCVSNNSLAANASSTFTLTVKVNAQPQPAQAGAAPPPLVNHATVASLTSDNAVANNSASSAGNIVDPPCSFTIAPASQGFTAAGGTVSVAVTTQNGCLWQASVTTAADFISIQGNTGGTGSGAVNLVIAVNSSLNARNGTVSIAGQTFTVTQSGIACAYAVTPESKAFDANGGNDSVTITATAGCPWQVASDAPNFVALTSAGSGSGAGTVSYSVTANPNASARTGTLTVTGRNFTKQVSILQGSKTEVVCTFALNPTSDSLTGRGGDRAFFVQVSPDSCEWAATSNQQFVVVTSDRDQSGSAYITYLVPPNPANTARSGTITIAQRVGAATVPRQSFTVTQAAGAATTACAYTLTIPPSSQNLDAGGSDGVVTVSAGAGCAWNAAVSAGANFITITNGGIGSGSGTVSFRVQPNTANLPRNGVLTIAGQTVTIRQAGVQSGTVCALTIDPASASFGAQGGDRAFFVNSSLDTCEWTATTAAPFIRVTSDRNQSGSAYITFVVDPNNATAARSGTLILALADGSPQQTFTITQAGRGGALQMKQTAPSKLKTRLPR